MISLLLLLMLRTEQPVETGITKEMAMMAITEQYKHLQYSYKIMGDIKTGVKAGIELLKMYCDPYPSILTALSNFETSFLNRGKDKVTDILLKELGAEIKKVRRAK